jgi:hypothetical protein
VQCPEIVGNKNCSLYVPPTVPKSGERVCFVYVIEKLKIYYVVLSSSKQPRMLKYLMKYLNLSKEFSRKGKHKM